MPTESLRILQILRAPTGGLWRHAADLTLQLAAKGHSVGMVIDSEFSDRQTKGRLDRISNSLSLGLHKIPIQRAPNAGDIGATLKVRALSRKLSIDVLHGHGAKGGFYARLSRFGNSQAIAVYTPHGGVLNFPQRSFQGRIYRCVERGILPFTDAIIFESHFAWQAYCAQTTTPNCLAPVIHNGLNTSEFSVVPEAPDACDFVFIGELRDVKGVNFLLEALAKVKKPNGAQPSLVIAGDGPQRGALEALTRSLGLSDHVTFLGIQPVREVFSRGHVVVVPSLQESLPYVILEAAAAHKPIISTNVGGIAELFGPTADALIPPGDTEALTAAMQHAIDDPANLEIETSTRLDYIRPLFSVETMTEEIEATYAAAIRNRR